MICRSSSVSLVTVIWDGWFGVSNFGKGKIFSCLQKCRSWSGAYPAPSQNGYRVSFLGEKLSGLEFDRSLPSSAAVKDGWRYIAVPLYYFVEWTGKTFDFYQKHTYKTWLIVPWTVHHDINFEAITNLMHTYLYSYNITILYMFRATLCSSSGGSIVYVQHLALSLSVSGRTAAHRQWQYQMLYIYNWTSWRWA